MPRTHLVELINIDQSETGKIQLGIPLLAEIDAVCVELPQFGRQDVQAISRFAASLVATSRGVVLLPCSRSNPNQCATILRNHLWKWSAHRILLQGTRLASFRI